MLKVGRIKEFARLYRLSNNGFFFCCTYLLQGRSLLNPVCLSFRRDTLRVMMDERASDNPNWMYLEDQWQTDVMVQSASVTTTRGTQGEKSHWVPFNFPRGGGGELKDPCKRLTHSSLEHKLLKKSLSCLSISFLFFKINTKWVLIPSCLGQVLRIQEKMKVHPKLVYNSNTSLLTPIKMLWFVDHSGFQWRFHWNFPLSPYGRFSKRWRCDQNTSMFPLHRPREHCRTCILCTAPFPERQPCFPNPSTQHFSSF